MNSNLPGERRPERNAQPAKRPLVRRRPAHALLVLLIAVSVGLAACFRSPRSASDRQPIEPPPIEAGQVPPPGPYAPGFDALHYQIALALPDSGTYIEGRTAMRVLLKEDHPASLPLDFTGLAVTSVMVDGSEASYQHENGKLGVELPASASTGDTLEVIVTYEGTPDDGLILGRNIHGKPTAFADNWPNRARFWFPSIDHPSDKATVTFDVVVSAESGREVIANGLPLEDGSPGRYQWSTSEPIPTYTMVVGAADFAVSNVGRPCVASTCTEVSTWLFPPDTARGAGSFRRAAEMVRFYSELIAPFPYTKLAHVQSSTRFGGMENVSAIFYPEEPIADGADIESTVAHETAHQWFGDAVTESDWHHLWLSEGFATYFGALFFESADGVERFREMMRTDREQYLHSESINTPIVTSSVESLFRLLNANNYQKGGWVLHMLRRRLGDETFFRGIREYFERFEHSTALTDDFRTVMERVSGEKLEAFFDQWVFSPGFPRFELSWSPQDSGAVLAVEQVQPDDWPTFDVPLTLRFDTANGPVDRQIRVDARTEEFQIELPARPTELTADPEVDLLHEIVAQERSSAP